MSALLASDADRERTAEHLRAAAAEGRLTPEELEERLETAFSGAHMLAVPEPGSLAVRRGRGRRRHRAHGC